MKSLPLIASAVLLILSSSTGCHRESLTLEYVVPVGFSGILKLKADLAAGVSITPADRRITLNFPPTGILEIKGTLPTLDWHKPVARFADGTSLPIPGPTVAVPDDVVALRGLGGKNNNTEQWYLVGKADEMQEAINKFHGFQVSPR